MAGSHRTDPDISDPDISDPDPQDDGPVDEVGFDLGADEVVPGLLDHWTGRARSSGEGSTTGELTGSFRPDELPLTAILARVAAGLGREAAADRFSAREGRPSDAVKGLIADEPLDPLPHPEGLPFVGIAFAEPDARIEVTAVAPLPGHHSAPWRSGPLQPPAADPLVPPGQLPTDTAKTFTAKTFTAKTFTAKTLEFPRLRALARATGHAPQRVIFAVGVSVLVLTVALLLLWGFGAP